MPSNLLFLTPDIPYRCTNYSTYTTSSSTNNPNESDFYPHRNSLRGEKYQHYISGVAASEHSAVYDLGHVGGVANTRASNFIVLSRLDFMDALNQIGILEATMNYALQSSSDDVTYTDRHTITDVSTASLIGSWSNDYVSTFTATSAFRYWRSKWTKASGADFTLRIGKVYFGTAFDIGTDPSDFKIERKKSGQTSFVTDGGVKYQSRVKHPTYEINLEYEGLTDTEMQSFKDEIVKYRYSTPIFLYTSSFHEPTDGKQLIFCKLAEWKTEQRKADWHRLTCRFVESHG